MAGRGVSRRQFLMIGGGSAAVLWAGRMAWGRPGSGAGVAMGAVDGPVAGRTLRGAPFTDSFANPALPEWNVRRSVAILGTTPFGVPFSANRALDRSDFLHGRGTVIGLDGSLAQSTAPGLIETMDAFAFDAGSSYSLTFSVAGSHRNADRMPPSTLSASLPGLGVSKNVTVRPRDDFLEFTLDVPVVQPATSTIVFASGDAPGQAGALLESVSLTQKP